MGPGVVSYDCPVFLVQDDACKVAIFLAFHVLVCLYYCIDATELVFKFVDGLWRYVAVEVGNLVA